MLSIGDEIIGWYGLSDSIKHSGVAHDDNPPGRGSGRYEYGSGQNPYQRIKDFQTRIAELQYNGIKGRDKIAEALDLTPSQYDRYMMVLKHAARWENVEKAKAYLAEGKSKREVGRLMGVSDKTIESWLDAESERRMNVAYDTAKMLMAEVDEHGLTDVGVGVNHSLNISEVQMKEALAVAEMNGYNTFRVRQEQLTNPGKYTTLTVLAPPNTPFKIKEDRNGKPTKVSAAIYEELEKGNLHTVDKISHDDGVTFDPTFVRPKSLDSKRLQVVFAEDGGTDKDGVIELRRGVDDISLGTSTYSQVRILVDDTHYLKGMAVYADDLPPGIDVRFNTNKSKSVPIMGDKKLDTVLKIAKRDPKTGDLAKDPFGSLVKDGIEDPDIPADKRKPGGQSYYYDKDGNKQLRLINKVRDEGDWESWADKLPPQFLAKQPQQLIDRQIKLTVAAKENELKEIEEVTNPTLRKHLLGAYASDCDKMAENLKLESLPSQKYQVLLPVPSLKDNEVYAPNYEDGSTVALIRFPHGGQFEVAVRTVNNKNKEADKIITAHARDAIGVNGFTAQQLSGADYDGDTAMVIPCNSEKSSIKILSKAFPDALVNFDAKMKYGGKKEGTYQKMKDTQKQMGVVTNLLTDMTELGAKDDELIDVIKHTMVVIDAEKHGLDWKQSEKDHNIAKYQKIYQDPYKIPGTSGRGATIFTRAKSELTVDRRQGDPKINQKGKDWYDPDRPEGALIYKTADDLYYQERKKVPKRDENGKVIKTEKLDKNGNVVKTLKLDKNGDPVLDKNGNEVYKTSYETVYETYIDKNGNEKFVKEPTGRMLKRTQKSTKMAETDDAFTLLPENASTKQVAYAKFANTMKNLANEARKEMVYTEDVRKNPDAAKLYEKEVKALESSLKLSTMNSQRERQAQVIANSKAKVWAAANPSYDKSDYKKFKQQALTEARNKVGAKRYPITITPKEWEAIQAGAVPASTLRKVFDHTDLDKLKEMATPRNSKVVSDAAINRIKAMASVKDGAGNPKYSRAEIAEAAGVSTSTVSKYMQKG